MSYIQLLLCLCLYCLRTWSAQVGVSSNSVEKPLASMSEEDPNHKPIFTDCGKYAPEVKEEQPRDTFVIKVQAEDPDPPDKEGGRVTYGIEEQPGARKYFWINNATGEIYTNFPFDRDEPTRKKELYLIVRAVDDGRPQLADICTIKVTVTDTNDNTPSFDQLDYTIRVSEDHPENTEVSRVFAYDSDTGENARLTYSFGHTGITAYVLEDYFKIDPKTGIIYLQQKLIGKQGIKYTSTVAVQDNGNPPLNTTADISFTVVDSNKRPPTINVIEQKITLKEDVNNFEDDLVTLTANSNINDPSIQWEIMKGKTEQTNKDQTFLLTRKGTQAGIKPARHLDYEKVTEYQLTVRAFNKDMLYAAENIIVTVTDVNDEVPNFIELLKGSVVENDKKGAQAMTVRAVDKDGTSPNNLVVYELITHKEFFAIDEESGVITAKVSFDREKESVYHVTVQARDSAPTALLSTKIPNSANQTFQITIEDQNDNQPRFENATYEVFHISESSDKQKDVIEVKAKDQDTASRITYSIIEGNEDEAFYIEESTGRIKVNKKLDFEKIERYNLTVKADDGRFDDTAAVIIHIDDVNDELPVFEDYTKDVHVKEETTSDGCIITLTAYDPDIKDRSADQKIVYRVGPDYKSFLSVSSDGCVTLIRKLDRDPPKGNPSYQAYIHAYDENGGPTALSNYAEINIILEDINDNAPILNITEVLWYENEPPGRIVTLTATDNDRPQNGPPYIFQIPGSTDISDKFRIENSVLYANVVFDREEQKYYNVPINITDSGVPPQSGISILKVIIGDRNDNAAQDGSSEILVYKYEGFTTDTTDIGRVYVNDPDDWDLPDKVFQSERPLNANFELHDYGMIAIIKETLVGEYPLRFLVTEQLPNGTSHQVHADVKVTVKEIPEEAVRKSGSIRLKGATIEEFVEKDPLTQLSKKDKLQRHIAIVLNTSLENVDIFTVMTSPSNSSFVDVRFSAHGSPYYAPEKLNNKASEEQNSLETELLVEFIMISINECLQNGVCANSSCLNVLDINGEPAVVFTNKTSFVGIKAIAKAQCSEWAKKVLGESFNGGINNFTSNNNVYNLGAPSDKYSARGGTCNFGTFQAGTFGIDSNFLVVILVCLACHFADPTVGRGGP